MQLILYIPVLLEMIVCYVSHKAWNLVYVLSFVFMFDNHDINSLFLIHAVIRTWMHQKMKSPL